MKHHPSPISYKTKQDDPNANTVIVKKHQIKRREWRRQRLSDVMRTQGSQGVAAKGEKSERKG